MCDGQRWGLLNYNSQLFPGRNKAETMEGVISDIHHLPVSQSVSQSRHTRRLHCFPLDQPGLAWPGWQCLLGQRDFNESWGDISGLLAGQRTTKLGFWQIGIGIYVFIILCDDGFMTFLFFNLSQSEWRNNIWITFTFRSPVVTQSLFYPGLCILHSSSPPSAPDIL